jgi:hypothetical protein
LDKRITNKQKIMNKLFNHLSWSAYLETTVFLLALYYTYIAWKYYQPEIQQLIDRLSGNKTDSNKLPTALQYQEEEQPQQLAASLVSNSDSPRDEYAEERADLTNGIQTLISSAQGKPYNAAILIPQLKKLLTKQSQLAVYPHREAINELIVQECEKTGTALLSESEVDLWWEA